MIRIQGLGPSCGPFLFSRLKGGPVGGLRSYIWRIAQPSGSPRRTARAGPLLCILGIYRPLCGHGDVLDPPPSGVGIRGRCSRCAPSCSQSPVAKLAADGQTWSAPSRPAGLTWVRIGEIALEAGRGGGSVSPDTRLDQHAAGCTGCLFSFRSHRAHR